MFNHLRLDHRRAVVALLVVAAALTGCSRDGEEREERGVGYVTILADGTLEVSVGCPSDDPEFTVEEDDEHVALSIAYTATNNLCAWSVSPNLAQPLGDRTIHDRLTGELAIVADHRCVPPSPGARCDGVPSAPLPDVTTTIGAPSETTEYLPTTLLRPRPTTTTSGAARPDTTTTTGAPLIELPRSGGCGEAGFLATSPDDTVGVLVIVDVDLRAITEPTTIAVEPEQVEIVRGRELLDGFCTDLIPSGHAVDEQTTAVAGSGTVVVWPLGPELHSCGADGTLHLEGVIALDGTQFAPIEVETDQIGCTPG